MALAQITCTFLIDKSSYKHQQDLARRISTTFKICHPSFELNVIFLPIVSSFNGSTFFSKSSMRQIIESGSDVSMIKQSDFKSKDLIINQEALHIDDLTVEEILRITLIVPAGPEFGSQIQKDEFLNRLSKEIRTWILSFEMNDPNGLPSDPLSVPLSSRTDPIIEYRQLEWGSHFANGEIVRAPYGVM
ncbi:hypothetical protein BY996DRAFT_55015 [Phakopsora pachyrhizi]|nr:hypothetical protein BY996DRAFT_55015 [Phakopsora pachyrhizi]